MTHRYSAVYRYTHVWVAEQRDTLDDDEMREARAMDAAEPGAHKAWRRIMQRHDHIRYQIGEIRRALYDMGAGLSPRGKRYIEALHREGMKWYDPKPDVSLIEAQKRLLSNIATMRGCWDELYKAERSKK